jgi:cytochrome c-type biogenesis protein CcmH
MRQRLATIVLFLVLAGLSIPQTGTTVVTAQMRPVADKLACKCGSCNNTVATCSMLQCHYSLPAREKIAKMQAAGASDQEIIDSFVKEVGLAALAVPPAEGFNLLGWVMPFVGILIGLSLVAIYLKRFRKPAEAPTPARPIDEAYRSRIEKEMADLD